MLRAEVTLRRVVTITTRHTDPTKTGKNLAIGLPSTPLEGRLVADAEYRASCDLWKPSAFLIAGRKKTIDWLQNCANHAATGIAIRPQLFYFAESGARRKNLPLCPTGKIHKATVSTNCPWAGTFFLLISRVPADSSNPI